MKKQAMWVVAALSVLASGCGVEQPVDAEADQLKEQAYADVSFQATVQWLEGKKGIPVDLSQGVLEHREGATRLNFALPSEEVSQLAFELRADGSTRVYTNERVTEDAAQDVAAQAACGTYRSSDSCTTGPYVADAQGCAAGPGQPRTPLYIYYDYARDWFQSGRRVTQMGSWKNCSWMAQSTTCNNTCS
ncbi:hypothetical protein [Archangium lansingense]|uniref:Lipoprotein n=1 Tax=Archangium lansingense TaxID=2995310 RepID=A0ABT4A604_9BACT|nr:hypothetical protein [Archangium lansinium]MCY1077050.1 hypothetical protein [Archangium lansinium]